MDQQCVVMEMASRFSHEDTYFRETRKNERVKVSCRTWRGAERGMTHDSGASKIDKCICSKFKLMVKED